MVMCKAMEEMRNEAALEARLEERKKFIQNLLEKGTMSYEEIAVIAELSVEEVRELAEKNSLIL